jgi:hypothetical protein
MISNPNSEIRMSKEVRIPKSESTASWPAGGGIELAYSDFGILSGFGFRVSGFCSRGH